MVQFNHREKQQLSQIVQTYGVCAWRERLQQYVIDMPKRKVQDSKGMNEPPQPPLRQTPHPPDPSHRLCARKPACMPVVDIYHEKTTKTAPAGISMLPGYDETSILSLPRLPNRVKLDNDEPNWIGDASFFISSTGLVAFGTRQACLEVPKI